MLLHFPPGHHRVLLTGLQLCALQLCDLQLRTTVHCVPGIFFNLVVFPPNVAVAVTIF